MVPANDLGFLASRLNSFYLLGMASTLLYHVTNDDYNAISFWASNATNTTIHTWCPHVP